MDNTYKYSTFADLAAHLMHIPASHTPQQNTAKA
jgi:hypothetical protein